MTETATVPPRTDSWALQLEQLRARYKHVRPPILAALNVLLHDPNIADDDAKSRAQLHGVRITVASIRAAKTLLTRMDAPEVAAPAPKPKREAQAPARPARRPRAPARELDAEAMIRNVVGKLQAEGNAEAERLRAGIRKAIAALQATIA